ncbi:cation diffusion facilitator family transporter [Polynucleobacter meluiroseus]|jgi:cation diffusion facilitator family transporter|uniref:Cation diffusion facilitator family transporter n=1 Tax=Polynucleobacter meluiroseus TaxID=1938814 RepID=A0A240DZM3_9BURK|nr:cation diffusion facilitator family transporter [Polynucleobacter meluiroseus]SNX28639.1 cation diffusion facilitator family transporter [Polynucleobacter meluiroseus]
MEPIESLLIENPELDSVAKQKAGRNSTLVSVLVNLGLTLSQVTAGVLAGSQGLIADGIHSLTDLVADFVVLFANHHSSKDADEDHHYGHQRYETAASLFLGVSLLVVGLGMLWAAGNKIINPVAAGQIQILALYVALGALAAKELLFRYMLAVAERVRSSMLVANAWHARSDAASSLVVSVGIVGALLGYPILDSVGALVVGLMITKTGWSFSWDALNDLMDRAVSSEEHQKIIDTIMTTEGVKGCHDLRTRKMGDMILADVHIEVDKNATVQVGHDIAFAAAKKVTDTLPVLNVMTHVDPV